jgi:hypothetical protein
MVHRGRIICGALADCCDELLEYPGKTGNFVRGTHRKRLKLCLGIVTAAGNHALQGPLYSYNHDYQVEKICSAVAENIRNGCEGSYYCRMIRQYCKDIERRCKGAELMRLDNFTVWLFRALRLLDECGRKMCGPKDWSDYQVWVAYDIERQESEERKSRLTPVDNAD